MSTFDPTLYGVENLLAILATVVIPLILALVVNVVLGIIAVSMAKKRDLRPVPAFFLGFFAGIVGLFIVALTPKRY